MNKLNTLINVLEAIKENYEASDFLYPQAEDETNIDFAFRSEPEHFVKGAIVEDLSDLGLMVVSSDVYQTDIPILGGYIASFQLRSDWIDSFEIPAESWAAMVLGN